MKIEKPLLPLFLLILAMTCIKAGYTQRYATQDPNTTTPDQPTIVNKLSAEEYRLYTLIQDYRKQYQLPALPLSNSLVFVAKTHVIDLVQNKPDLNGCNARSWSDKGTWTACCVSRDGENGSLNKPRELLPQQYNGAGYELVLGDNGCCSKFKMTADYAFNAWIKNNAAFVRNKVWKNIGIAIYNGFAVAWFGATNDLWTPSTAPPSAPAPGPVSGDRKTPGSQPDNTGNNTGSVITWGQAKAALDFHNLVRAEVGVPPLQWSRELSIYAQRWAEHIATNGCSLEHRPESGVWAQLYGENIYSSSGQQFSPLIASKNWYSEKRYFTYGQENNSAGHYTQMIWAKTTKVGMGMAKCPDGSVIIVANYDPPGNYIGENPY